MDVEALLAAMDEPETKGALPSGINIWERVLYDVNAPNPRKVEGGKKAQRSTRERHGVIIRECENPDCTNTFEVPQWKRDQIRACSQPCRDKMGRLRRAGKIPSRPLAPNVRHKPWTTTERWKRDHPTEES